MNSIAPILCRVCGDKEELERCYDVLSFTFMNMGRAQNQQAALRSMVQPMAQPMPSSAQYDPNPYQPWAPNPYQNPASYNPNPYGQYAQPHGLTGQHSPMYLNTVPQLYWCDVSHESLDVATTFGDINDTMLLVEPVLKMFKGLKAAYRITSPAMNDFTILDDDNIFDEELYVWGHCVSEEQLKSFSAKLASMVIRGEEGPYTFQGTPMKYSDLADDLKITNIPEGIGIMRYHRISRQQKAQDDEQKRITCLRNPMDPQDTSR